MSKRHIHFGRGFGHTQAMLNGAKNIEGVVIIAHTQVLADQLAAQCKGARGVGLDNLHRLRGLRCPIVLDHTAITLIKAELENRESTACAIMEKFVDKVDTRKAHSIVPGKQIRETYAEMKEWLEEG